MSTVAAPPPPTTEPTIEKSEPLVRTSAWRRWLTRPVKLLLGMLLCQNPLTTLLVVGWTHRSMTRLINRGFVIDSGSHSIWPIRIVRQTWRDFCKGFAVVVNGLLLTLPVTGLWYLAWLLGWNVSFFKGYEQSHLGAGLGLSGIFLFSLVMLYVPVAVCHQAASGSWKSFWDVTTVRRLVWRTGWWHVLLAAVFGLLSMPVMVARMAPYFLNAEGNFDNFTNEQLVAWLNGYYFWVSLIVIPAFWLAWRIAAMVYRRCRRETDNSAGRVWLRRWISIPRRIVTIAGLGSASLIWMAVAMQIFIAQFFNYVPGHGWLVHPVLVMPWLRFIPQELLSS